MGRCGVAVFHCGILAHRFFLYQKKIFSKIGFSIKIFFLLFLKKTFQNFSTIFLCYFALYPKWREVLLRLCTIFLFSSCTKKHTTGKYDYLQGNESHILKY